MANAFSPAQSFGRYIDPVDTNLVNAALSAKQQRYDYNVAKIDSLLSEFSSIELARNQDKQYLADRVNGVLNTVNEMQKDLSKSGQTRDIMRYINTAIDDNVLEQASNTIRLKSFEQSVAERKEKKPETYSDINYTYAKERAGVSDYLRGTDKNGNAVNSFGNLQYSEYKDVNKRINDFIIDIQNKKKDEIVEIPQFDENGNRTGTMLRTTISGLSPVQIRQLSESQLDATYMQQVKINGWYNSGGYESPTEIKTGVEFAFKNKIDNIEAESLKLQRELEATNISPEDRSKKQADLDSYTTEKTRLVKDKDFLLTNTEAAATYLEKEKVLSSAVSAFGQLYSKTDKLVKDDLYFAQQDLNIKQLKLQHEIDKETKSKEPSTIVTTRPTTLEEIPKIEAFVDESIDRYSTSMQGSLQEYKSALEAEAKKGNTSASKLLDEYQKRLATKKSDQTDEDVFSSVVSSIGYDSNLAIIGNKNYVAQIKEDKDKLSILLEGKQVANQQGLATHIDATINSKEGFKAFYDNPDTKMLWKGRPVPVKDVLISSGLMDRNGNKIGDIKTKEDVLKELQKSFYADDILSNTGIKYRNTDILPSTEALKSLNQLVTMLGENPSEAYEKFNEMGIGYGEGKTWYRLKPGSKTAAYVEEARRNGIYDTWGWNDQSLSSDDATIAKFVKEDYKSKDTYTGSLQKFYDKLPTNQIIGIPSTDKINFEKLSSLITANTTSTFIPDKTGTINMRLEGDYIVLSQPQQEKQDKQNVIVNKEAKVLRNDFLRAMPELSQKIDFNTESSFYTIEKLQGKTLKSEPIKFFDNSTSPKTYNWTAQVLLKDSKSLTPYIDSTSANKILYSANRRLEQRYGKEQFSNLINTALAKSGNFAINSTVEVDFNNNPYINEKLIDKNTQKVIHSRVVDYNQIPSMETYKQLLDNSPQVLYSILINDILAREVQQQTLGDSSKNTSFANLLNSL